MPAKAPMYLKTGGRSGPGGKGPRKLREILSADMISPPLGDFRHTAHVGRGGSDDMFGDTSFLKDETESTWNSTSKLSEKPVNGGSMNFYHLSGSHTLDSRNKKKISQAEVDDGGSTTLKSASSLPHLSTDEETASEKERQAFDDHCVNSRSEEDVSLAQSQLSGTPVRTSNGPGGPPKPRRILSTKTGSLDDETEHEIHSGILPDQSDFDSETLDCSEDETWKFDLDLGPPLMEEIMGIIGKSKSSS